MAGGWSAKPGSGLKYDGGDAFSLDLVNRLQVHWTYTGNENGPDVNTFNIRRARTTFSGHVFNKDIHYKLQMDWVDQGPAGDGAIKEGHVQWNFANSDDGTVGLRVGQGKTMFGLEATGTSGGLWFVERSSASRAFSDSYSRGAWINGVVVDHKLRYSVGAMNTDVAGGLGGAAATATGYTDRGEETANSDNELSYVLTVNFDPLGDFFDGKQTTESRRQGDWRTDDRSLKGTVGAGVAFGNGRTATAVGGAIQDIESTSINVNTEWTVARFSVLAEYFMRTDDQQGPIADKEEPTGWAVSAGYLFDKSGDSSMQWGVGLRVNSVENDVGNNATVDFLTGMQGIGAVPGNATEVTAVLNAFYHAHQCKTQLEYTYQNVDPDGAASSSGNSIIRIGFQIEF
ncbi:MAG TPA: porin [Planctomycetota bacterium]|nr:porin [Planctomycetota bacterium]